MQGVLGGELKLEWDCSLFGSLWFDTNGDLLYQRGKYKQPESLPGVVVCNKARDRRLCTCTCLAMIPQWLICYVGIQYVGHAQ